MPRGGLQAAQTMQKWEKHSSAPSLQIRVLIGSNLTLEYPPIAYLHHWEHFCAAPGALVGHPWRDDPTQCAQVYKAIQTWIYTCMLCTYACSGRSMATLLSLAAHWRAGLRKWRGFNSRLPLKSAQHLSEAGCNFSVAARAFQEDVFWDKNKVWKYSSRKLGFSL